MLNRLTAKSTYNRYICSEYFNLKKIIKYIINENDEEAK